MLAQKAIILSWTLSLLLVMSPPVQAGDEVVHKDEISFAFYGDTIHLQPNHWQFVPLEGKISEASIQVFYDKMDAGHYQDIVAELLAYKEKNHLNDWFYYQLIRKTVQAISPKRKTMSSTPCTNGSLWPNRAMTRAWHYSVTSCCFMCRAMKTFMISPTISVMANNIYASITTIMAGSISKKTN
jgi:hypothetical protein